MSVYLRAAVRVDGARSLESCIAIAKYLPKEIGPCLNIWHDKVTNYAGLFAPAEHPRPFESWGVYWGDGDERKQCRVLALLFAHAMHETGDL